MPLTLIMMLLTDITITHIIVLVTSRILLTISDRITVGLVVKATTELMPTTIGLDITEHSILVDLTIMLLQVNMSGHRIQVHTTGVERAEGAEQAEQAERLVLLVLLVLLVQGEQAEQGGQAEQEAMRALLVQAALLAQEVSLDHVVLRHPHNHKAAQESVGAQAEEEAEAEAARFQHARRQRDAGEPPPRGHERASSRIVNLGPKPL